MKNPPKLNDILLDVLIRAEGGARTVTPGPISWTYSGSFYPMWQFNGDGQVLPGIREALDIFNSGDQWRIMRYFLHPRQQLDGKRVIDLLRAGEVKRVLIHARLHAKEKTW